MAETLLKYSDVEVVLTTGTVIKARCASIEETDIVDSICEALRARGAVIKDCKVVRSCDVTGMYARRLRGEKA